MVAGTRSGRAQPDTPGGCMFIDDPGAIVALDSQQAALPLSIGMVGNALLEGVQEAVGQAFEGGISHCLAGLQAPERLDNRACGHTFVPVYPRPCCAAGRKSALRRWRSL